MPSLPKLDWVATGAIPPNPAELLESDRFWRVLRELSARYGLVVIDNAPILAVTEGALVGRLAGVNLLVLRAGKHPVGEIAHALRPLTRRSRSHGDVFSILMVCTGDVYRSAIWPSARGHVHTLWNMGKFDAPDPFRQDRAACERSPSFIERGLVDFEKASWSPRT